MLLISYYKQESPSITNFPLLSVTISPLSFLLCSSVSMRARRAENECRYSLVFFTSSSPSFFHSHKTALCGCEGTLAENESRYSSVFFSATPSSSPADTDRLLSVFVRYYTILYYTILSPHCTALYVEGACRMLTLHCTI